MLKNEKYIFNIQLIINGTTYESKQENLMFLLFYPGKIFPNREDEINPYCLVYRKHDRIENMFYAMLIDKNKLLYFSCDIHDQIMYDKNGERNIWYYDKIKKEVLSPYLILFMEKKTQKKCD